MKTRIWASATSVLALFACAATALAVQVTTPTFETFGHLDATFGGTGIPNDNVAYTSVPPDGIVLGLTATGRYANPATTNNGAGTFYALPGGDVANGQSGYAMWNVDFYSATRSGQYPVGTELRLYYDLDPAIGNDMTSFLVLPIGYQDSWNLGMSFLGGGFDPNATGEYSFDLRLLSPGGALWKDNSINVEVGSASSVPESGETAMYIGLGLMLLFGLARLKSPDFAGSGIADANS